jgi:hypothetical protein
MKAWILRILGAAGTLLFASLFLFTLWRPAWVEQAARDFITTRVEERVGRHVTGVNADGRSALARAAGELYRQNAARIEDLNATLRTNLHERIAAALTQIRDPACACRARIATLLDFASLSEIGSLEAMNSHLTDFIHGQYLRVVDELTRDLRVFTAINALACLLLLITSFVRPRAIDHLMFPGTLLAVAVIVSSYCYAFEQNWFFTIVYSNYFGFAYLGLLTFIFGLLLDIFLNRGRVTTQAGNVVLHAVGSTFSLAIC